jgi:DNA-directed RNA polymerase specialized sigma subunit
VINAKEYLQQIELYDAHIKNKLEEITSLRSMIMHITSTLRPDGGSPSGGASDKVGDTVAKIIDMEAEVNAAVDKFVNLKREISNLIDCIKDPDEIRLLHLRYFSYAQWEEIALKMGYTYRNVCYIHSRALQSVNKLLEARAKDGG